MTEGASPAATEAQRRARQRARIADGARLLPFLGVVLFLMPDLILSGSDGSEGATAAWLVYLFVAWLLLIALAVWIGRLQGAEASEEDG